MSTDDLPAEGKPLISAAEIDALLKNNGLDPLDRVEKVDLWYWYWGEKTIEDLVPREDRHKIAAFIFQEGGLGKLPSLLEFRINEGLMRALEIRKWPSDFLIHPTLKSFYFAGNPPVIKSISGLKGLVSLSFDSSHSKKLPPDIGQLVDLESLVASDHVEELPDSFKNLSKLSSVNFANCRFQKMPDWFWTMSSLTDIDFSYNPLREVPVGKLDLPNLQSINLYETPYGIYRANVAELGSKISVTGGSRNGYVEDHDWALPLPCINENFGKDDNPIRILRSVVSEPVPTIAEPSPSFPELKPREFSKLKKLLLSDSKEDVDQGIALAAASPGVFAKLLKDIELSPGLNAWSNNGWRWGEACAPRYPSLWGPKTGTQIPLSLNYCGEILHLGNVPENDLFNRNAIRMYALLSLINVAPAGFAPADQILSNLKAIHWDCLEGFNAFPTLDAFHGLRYLYIGFSSGPVSIPNGVEVLALENTSGSIDWVADCQGIKSLAVNVDYKNFSVTRRSHSLKEIYLSEWRTQEFHDMKGNSVPRNVFPFDGLEVLRIGSASIQHADVQELLQAAELEIDQCSICSLTLKEQLERLGSSDSHKKKSYPAPVLQKFSGEKGSPISPKEISSLKKLLTEDDPAAVLQAILMLQGASIATFETLLGQADFSNGITWDIPFFDKFRKRSLEDSYKLNALTECAKISLVSMAPQGYDSADGIKAAMRWGGRKSSYDVQDWDLLIPDSFPVPLHLGGYKMIEELVLPVDFAWADPFPYKGVGEMSMLKKLTLEIKFADPGQILQAPLMDLPPSLEELVLHPSAPLTTLDFLPPHSGIKVIKAASSNHDRPAICRLGLLNRFRDAKISRLNVTIAEDTDFSGLPFLDSLIDLTVSAPALESLHGLPTDLKQLSLTAPILKSLKEIPTGLSQLQLDAKSLLSTSELKELIELVMIDIKADSVPLNLNDFKDLPLLDVLKLKGTVIGMEDVAAFKNLPDMNLGEVSQIKRLQT
jgi:hypothetical protein